MIEIERAIEKKEYIERGALKAHYSWLPKDATLTPKDFDDIIDAQSAVDVVSVEAYRQIMWERDTAIAQLAEYGIGFCEKKRDVEPVVRGEWRVTDAYPHRVYCSLCHKTNVPNEESLFERNEYPKFCMWCGAKMGGEKEGV